MNFRKTIIKASTALTASLVIFGVSTSAFANEAPSPTPAPSVTVQTAESLAALEANVSALNARAEELTAEIEEATKKYEDGLVALEAAKTEATKAETRAVEAELAAQSAKATVGNFARSSYINPVPAQAALLSTVSSGSPTDTIRGVGYLDRIGRDVGVELDVATTQSKLAREARTQATALRDAADASAVLLTAQLSDIQVEAAAAATELSAKVMELNVARTIAAAANATQVGGEAFADPAFTAELCNSTILTPSPASSQWGGFSNGLIPDGALCTYSNAKLRWDAVVALRAMDAAYSAEFGTALCITDSYRSFEAQVSTFAAKPTLAATPGNSNHGWGLAVDFCGGIESFSSAQHAWMAANAPSYGWNNPAWAQAGGSKPEAWHWNYGTFN